MSLDACCWVAALSGAILSGLMFSTYMRPRSLATVAAVLTTLAYGSLVRMLYLIARRTQ